jgi:8-amino-7-oxononanoate synthase
MSSDLQTDRLHDRLQRLNDANQLRQRRAITPISSSECLVDGRRCVAFASNDYLGLAHHPSVVRAFQEAASLQVGATASALVTGRTIWHEQLERRLARFEGTESAILYPSGFAANVGTLTSLVGAGDAVFCDRDNHASIVDGCLAAAGRMFVYRHQELKKLATSIHRRRSEFDQVFIATDSVFSMDGVVAPLRELCRIGAQFDADLIVDEAHATGVFGPTGRGVCEALEIEDQVRVRLGTLSKAIGTMGGFVASSRVVCDWLWNTARPQFFSTALPPAVCAAASESLRLIRTDVERATRLTELCRFARKQLNELGLETVVGSVGPIVPILLGDDAAAVVTGEQLIDHGFFVPAIRSPTVKAGTARLRLSLCSEHSKTQIEAALICIHGILAGNAG